jgi:RNA polymerase sigma-70 factor, ECF subfamily
MNYTENSSDKELVEAAKVDPDAFGLIVNRYWNRLFAYVKRTSYFSQEDIEDILQEVFIKIYKYLNDYDDSFEFSTWTYRITHNYVIDTIRKKNVRPQSANMDAEELANVLRSNLDTEKEILTHDAFDALKESIDHLPYKYRDVLTLRFLEEKEYTEIMDILQLPKGTVASLINRGKKILRDDLIKNGISLNDNE